MPSLLALLSKRFEDARAEYHDHIADVKSGYRDIFGRKTPQGRAEDKERRLKACAAMTDEERKAAKRQYVRNHHEKRKTKSGKPVATGSSSKTPRLGEMDEHNPEPATDTRGDGPPADEDTEPAFEEPRAQIAHKGNASKTNPSTGQVVDEGCPGLSTEGPAKDHRDSAGKDALPKSERGHTDEPAAGIRLDLACDKDGHSAEAADPDILPNKDNAHNTDQQANKLMDDGSLGSAAKETAKDDEALAEAGALV